MLVNPSPLQLLEKETPWAKSKWTCLVKTRITVYFEKKMRAECQRNSSMSLLNVQLLGLSAHPHLALQNIFTTRDVKKMRLHLKFLTGDYPHGERLSKNNPNISSACKLCDSPVDSTTHVLVSCRATAECRQRILPELLNTVAAVQPTTKIPVNPSASLLTQLIVDCTSINLQNSVRVPSNNPRVSEIFDVARDWCFAIHNERTRLINEAKNSLK